MHVAEVIIVITSSFDDLEQGHRHERSRNELANGQPRHLPTFAVQLFVELHELRDLGVT